MKYKCLICPSCHAPQMTGARRTARCVSCGKSCQLETKKQGKRWLREFDNPQDASAWVREFKAHEAETKGVRCPVKYINQNAEAGK